MSEQETTSPPPGAIPRGVEVLIKKASVDPAFKSVLTEKRADSAAEIGLALAASEAAIINGVPAGQLEAIIARTTVPEEHRRAFLGKAAAAMLAALAAAGAAVTAGGVALAEGRVQVQGIMPDRPPQKGRPAIEVPVIGVVANQLGVSVERISHKTRFAEDLRANAKQREAIRKALEKGFRVTIAAKTFRKFPTIADVSEHLAVRVPLTSRVVEIVVEELKLGIEATFRDGLLTKRLAVSGTQLTRIREALAKELRIPISQTAFSKLRTISQMVDCVEPAVKKRRAEEAAAGRPGPSSALSRGNRPDRPEGSRGSRPDRPPKADPPPSRGGVGGVRPGT